MRRYESRTATFTIFFILMLCLGAANGSLFAETRYVADRLIISIRAGQDSTSDVLGYIQSDTPVDVVAENGPYLKIATENGLEGWVKTKYITSEKPKALIIMDLKAEINHLQRKIEMLEHQAVGPAPTASTIQGYKQKINELEGIVQTHQQAAVGRDRELEKLKNENATLKSKMSHLKNSNKSPVKLKSMHWFLAGAGVLLIGFMVGRSARKEKRTSIYR